MNSGGATTQGATSGNPSTANQNGANRALTPPRQAPGTEASTGGGTGGAGGAGAGGAAGARGQGGNGQAGRAAQNGASSGPAGGGTDTATPRQEELMRKSSRIDKTVMRSICVGCEGSGGRSGGKKAAPAPVDVQAPLRQ
jgi:hypothetical protein